MMLIVEVKPQIRTSHIRLSEAAHTIRAYQIVRLGDTTLFNLQFSPHHDNLLIATEPSRWPVR